MDCKTPIRWHFPPLNNGPVKHLGLVLNHHRLRTCLAYQIAYFVLSDLAKSWGEQFDKANAILDSSSPNEGYYHKYLIPLENYSLTAKQILFAAGVAWVFGGMESWNDIGFDNKEDNNIYERLSEQLYSKINEAIVATTNTY